MTDRPILFSAPMVRALQEGRKTQTRRLAWKDVACPTSDGGHIIRRTGPSPWQRIQPGDRLWVRENFWHAPASMGFDATHGAHGHIAYTAGPGMGADAEDRARAYGVKHRPAIHMPRWASRLTLTVTAARVEPLRAISDEDASAEGVAPRAPGEPPGMAAYRFRELWDDLHGPDSWDANPEVVVLTFTVQGRNIDHA